MTETNPGLSSPKRLAAALIIVVMVVATVGVFAYIASNAIVRSDPGAMSLSASLNATMVQQNHALKLTMAEKNNLGFTNKVNFTDNWAVQGLSLGICGGYLPFGVGVYEGTYTSGNISTAKGMQIDYPGFVSCPLIRFDQSLTLGPSQSLTESRNLTGFWTSSNDSVSQGVLNPFPPGRYTVVVGDEWGRLQFLYFDVRGIALQGFGLCSSNCGYPSPYLSGIIVFDGSAPLRSLQLLVNGTAQAAEAWTANLTYFGLWYKGGFDNPPVVKGDTYVITFMATFQDGSTATATTVVKAT